MPDFSPTDVKPTRCAGAVAGGAYWLRGAQQVRGAALMTPLNLTDEPHCCGLRAALLHCCTPLLLQFVYESTAAHCLTPPRPPSAFRYKVMATPLHFDIKNQDDVIKQLPPFFNMKEKSEVMLLQHILIPSRCPSDTSADVRTHLLHALPRAHHQRQRPPRRPRLFFPSPLPVLNVLRPLHHLPAVSRGCLAHRLLTPPIFICPVFHFISRVIFICPVFYFISRAALPHILLLRHTSPCR